MCNFKNCQGPHACFLRDISPCPESLSENATTEEPRVTSRMRSRGFIDRDELIAALEVEDAAAKVAESNSNVVRITSKIQRVAEVLAHRKAS